MTLLFESETCGRCYGTGRYSFNLIDGDRCYGCNGKGERLTKRGAAAQAFLNELRSPLATEIVVGDVVFFDGGVTPSRWYVVTEIEHTETRWTEGGVERDAPSVRIKGDGVAQTVFAEKRVRKQFDAETEAALRAQALAFQETLTKTGKPRKR